MNECELPGCVRTASITWQGSKLCTDCYEKQKEKYERMLNDIADL